MKYLTVLILFISFSSYGQSDPIVDIITKIDFQKDTMNAVFLWVTDFMAYDVEKKNSRKKSSGKKTLDKTKYNNVEEYKYAELKKAIKKQKGVCEDYSLLFHKIVSELGYESYIVKGLTKDKNGKINNGLGHTWNTVKVRGEWKLYDPTWGAGYVNKKQKFVKEYSEIWFDVSPQKMTEKHFPFDPIWQLSSNPLSYKDFKNKNRKDNNNGDYRYGDMISAYMQMDKKEKSTDALSRVKKHERMHQLIRSYEDLLSKNLSASDITSITDVFITSGSRLNEYYKEGRSTRFEGEKWTKEYAKSELLDMKNDMNQAIKEMQKVKTKDRKSTKVKNKNISKAKEMIKVIDKELDFLK